jgi:hypothetical protein
MGSMNHWFQKKNIKQNKIVQSSDMLSSIVIVRIVYR